MSTIVAMPSRAPAGASMPGQGLTAIAGGAPAVIGAAVTLQSAPFKGFGFVRYGQSAADPPTALLPDVRTLFRMTIDPAQTIAVARAPFDQAAFWDGSTLMTPHVNDLLDIRLGFLATAAISGGTLIVEAMLATGGVLITTDAGLPDEAGSEERINPPILELFAGAGFVASGVQLFLTASVPCSIKGLTLLVAPKSSGA